MTRTPRTTDPARRRARPALLIAIVVAAAVLWPGTAAAGTYTVRSCAGGGGSTAGWAKEYYFGATTANMTLIAGCTGPPFYGLLAASSATDQIVEGREQANLGFTAPLGDTITHITWNGEASTAPLAGVGAWRAGVWWQGGSTMCTSGAGACHLPSGDAATSTPWVQIFVQCSAASCHTRSAAGTGNHAARVEVDSISLTISDPNLPTLAIGGPLWTTTKQGGKRELTYGASDASGISGVRFVLDGKLDSQTFDPQVCSYTRPVPCPPGVSGRWNIDLSHLSTGTHVAQVVTQDGANNLTSRAITIHVDNASAGGHNPPPGSSQIATVTRAGFLPARRHGILHVLTAPFGRRVRVAGRLTTTDGRGLANHRLAVTATPHSGAGLPKVLGHVTTDAQGAFTYATRARMSRTLEFAFTGTSTQLPSSARVRLRVPASSTFRASPRRIFNGSFTTFSGQLRGGQVPPGGVRLTLEYRAQRGWKLAGNFFRSDSAGRWSVSYPFVAIAHTTRLPWRLLVPSAGNYPFTTGHSRSVAVTVVGR